MLLDAAQGRHVGGVDVHCLLHRHLSDHSLDAGPPVRLHPKTVTFVIY
jgi:hypothetical protein